MKRRDPNAEAIVFRVLHLPQHLKDALKAKRKERQQTIKDFTWQMIDEGLAPLVESLSAVLPNPAGARQPMRIPLSDLRLTKLRGIQPRQHPDRSPPTRLAGSGYPRRRRPRPAP